MLETEIGEEKLKDAAKGRKVLKLQKLRCCEWSRGKWTLHI